MPRSETTVMVVTVVLTVVTENLSIGVLAGVIVAALLFARRVQNSTTVTRITPEHHRLHFPHLGGGNEEAGDTPADTDGPAIYAVSGELFFASSSDLADHFDYVGDPEEVIIDLRDSHIWDASTVAALDQVVAKYANHGKTVELVGMNEASRDFHGNLAGRLAPAG